MGGGRGNGVDERGEGGRGLRGRRERTAEARRAALAAAVRGLAARARFAGARPGRTPPWAGAPGRAAALAAAMERALDGAEGEIARSAAGDLGGPIPRCGR